MSRSSLLREIKSELRERGYRAAPGTNFGATALMFKRLSPDSPLLVLLAVQFSRIYDDAFTGYMCVSRTLRWAYRPNDCPPDMSVQLAQYLTREERSLLLDDELCGNEEVLRGWWRGFRSTNAARFIETVATVEPRFCAREQLLRQISHSTILEEWSNLRKHVLTGRTRVRVDAPESSNAEVDQSSDPLEVPENFDTELECEKSAKRYTGLRADIIHDGWMQAAESATLESPMRPENPTAFVRSLAQETWTLHRSGFNVMSM